MADGLVDDYGVPICGHPIQSRNDERYDHVSRSWVAEEVVRPCRVPVKSAKYADGKCQKHSDDPAAVRRREVLAAKTQRDAVQRRAFVPVTPFELMHLKVSDFLRLKAALNAITDGDSDTP
jgi:hypothetical protein